MPQSKVLDLTADFLLIEADLQAAELLPKLGGTIKIAKLLSQYQSFDKLKSDDIKNALQPSFDKSPGKYVFGISQYGLSKELTKIKRLGLELKKSFSGRSVRFFYNDKGALSSAAVVKNKLQQSEIILAGGHTLYLAQTRAVQDFEGYSRRDYGRPSRDSERGMLPPKLAQMMINLAGLRAKGKLLDPFCGAGTILQEASLLGFKNLVGTDKDAQAVAQTKENLNWLRKQGVAGSIELYQMPVANLRQRFKAESFEAIVTEPYLGPARALQKSWSPEKLSGLSQELGLLYINALKQFFQLLKPRGRVVMIWPVFRSGFGQRYIEQLRAISKVGFELKTPTIAQTSLKSLLTERQTLLYRRSGQKVGREILVWQKK